MMTHLKVSRVLVVAACTIALAFLAMGCSKKFPDCDKDTDCASNGPEGNILQHCCDNQCQECCADPDCPENRPSCSENRCVECNEDKDCPTEKPYCEDNKCVFECEIDSDCERRGKTDRCTVCKGNKCQAECQSDSDCESGKGCQENCCVEKCACQSDDDCPGGQACEDCACVAKSCELETIHFDFNRYDLRSEDRSILDRNAQCMQSRQDLTITIEGHCDERGTTEYNAALGDKRAKAARKYLENLGIPRSRVNTTSFGEERPICTDSTESCYSENRRCEFK